MRTHLLAVPLVLLPVAALAQSAPRNQTGQGAQQAPANLRVQYGVVVPGLSKPGASEQPRPNYKPNPLGARSGGTGD